MNPPTPYWIVSVFLGLWACAIPVYALSFATVVVVMGRAFLFAGVAQVIDSTQLVIEALFFLLSAFAVGFALWARAQGYFNPLLKP